MCINLNNIEIGKYIKSRVDELEFPIKRICVFFETDEKEIIEIYQKKSLDSNTLLRWCKLLGYDFFRVYSQNLILDLSLAGNTSSERKLTYLPAFRKSIYTQEHIDFILEMVNSGAKSKKQIIDEYHIPRTTLYRWIKNAVKNNQQI